MAHHDILSLALRDHERLVAEADRLRTELAAIGPMVDSLTAFIERYRAYEASTGCPGIDAPAADPRPAERSELPFPGAPAPAWPQLHPDSPASGEAAEELEIAAPAAYLVLGAATGARRIPITTTPLRIGSGEDCDVPLPPELGVAEEHAVVWMAEGEVLLRVPGCAGSVAVNGREMSWAYLDDGDVISLGGFEMAIAIAPAAVPALPMAIAV